MSTVLITGSCGLVGSEASTFFSQKGFKVAWDLRVDNRLDSFSFAAISLQCPRELGFSADIDNENSVDCICLLGFE